MRHQTFNAGWRFSGVGKTKRALLRLADKDSNQSISIGKGCFLGAMIEERREGEAEKKQPMVIVTFGEMGSGKSRVGLELSRTLPGRWGFYEGDDARPWYTRVLGFLTKDNNGCCTRYVSVEHFVRNSLIPAIVRESAQHPQLVVAQALYFRDHRELIVAELNKRGIKCRFVHVLTPVGLQDEQLRLRNCGCCWRRYNRLNRQYFEPPILADVNNHTLIHDNSLENRKSSLDTIRQKLTNL